MYQTLAVAVLVLMLGAYLKSKIYFLEKFCIPAPVIGGLLFAIFTCICYTTGVAEFSFDARSMHGIFLYFRRISGESQGAAQWRKIVDPILVSRHCLDRISKSACCWYS